MLPMELIKKLQENGLDEDETFNELLVMQKLLYHLHPKHAPIGRYILDELVELEIRAWEREDRMRGKALVVKDRKLVVERLRERVLRRENSTDD